MFLKNHLKLLIIVFCFLLRLKYSESTSLYDLAIGTDAIPYIIFWNPYTKKSPYTLPFPNTHTGRVNDLKCSSNNMLVSISNDTYVKIWNYADATNIWNNKMSEEQTAIGLVNNGFVVGGKSGIITGYRMTGVKLFQKDGYHLNRISAFEMMHNGNLVSGAEGGLVRVWIPVVNNLSPLYDENLGNPVKSFKRLPNANLAIGLNNGFIKVYNMTNERLVLEFKAHTLAVNALEVLENGDLASGSSDNTIKIWNGTSFNLTGQLNSHISGVNALKLLSNDLLASGSDDQTIKVWNTISMTKVNEVNVGHAVKVLELLKNDTFFNSTYMNIVRTGLEFNFSQLSFSEQTQLLNSNYDLSGCVVNCTNHGNCKFDSVNDSFVCACDEYYAGQVCQIDLRACSSSPCLNNATCVDNNTQSFKCECQIGYEGVYCENKINICANETCSSNGVCEDLNNLPKCKCFSMFEGETCSIESSQLKTIKQFISMSSIIAILAIICFYLIILIMDLLKYCLMVKAKRKAKKKLKKSKKRKQQVYANRSMKN